ncbi:MAG: ATP-binding protein [Vicinamibacterales bacterium]
MSSSWTERVSRTIGLRLAAWYLGTFLASTIVLSSLTYGLLASSLEARDHAVIQSTLREYAEHYRTGGFPELANALEIERRSGQHEQLFVRVVGPFQDVLLYSLPESWGAFDLSELGGEPNDIWGQVRAQDRNAVLEVATLPLGGGTVLQVGKTSETRDELLRNFRRVLLLGATAALGIGLVGGLLLTQSTLKPLRDLRDTVQRILTTGQTDDRVQLTGSEDAVDELSVLFNAMLARITTLIHGMRNALDHVAHDLRTPMTRLRVTAESALATNDPAKYREALSDCLEESDRVLSMLTTLMDISEAETGTMRLNVSEVNVAQAVAETVELYEDAAEDAGVSISTSVPELLMVRADRDRLRQALANLVDNAIKYTGEGGRVEIEAARDADQARIRIHDTGVGIAARDLPRIWDRLYRGDQSRATRGLGLGLSVVRAYAQAQGGSVEVESEPGRGSTFILRLPA